jgi:putative addiction module killer protein
MFMLSLKYYLRADGSSPFRTWFESLNDIAHARVTRYLTRLEQGNTSNVKAIGEGVSELKVDFGPGYRIYFGMDGRTVVILLGGGTKKRQDEDILSAQGAWRDYKARTKNKD